MSDSLKPVSEQISPTTANDLLKRQEAVIFDVRESEEFAEEHIAGARSLPLSAVDPQQLTPAPGRLRLSTAHSVSNAHAQP